MSQLDDNKRLSEMTIPGTHDSGTYTLGDGPVDSAAKCQTQSIAEQLNNGIRYLDIRLARGQRMMVSCGCTMERNALLLCH